jgi:hypothetical protein
MADIWPIEKRSQVMGRILGKGNKSTEMVVVKQPYQTDFRISFATMSSPTTTLRPT